MKGTLSGKRYFVKFAVASAKQGNDYSKTLYVSGQEHAEKLLIGHNRSRLPTIRSLYISYSPCSLCVVAIINAFASREQKPSIGFWIFHGNPKKCSRLYAINNLWLLRSLGFPLFIMDRRVFVWYIKDVMNMQQQLMMSLDINKEQFDQRECHWKNELKNLQLYTSEYPCGRDCRTECPTLLAVATFRNRGSNRGGYAFPLLNELERDSKVRASVQAITFTYFPPACLSLRLIQVFHINNCKPVVRFFAINNDWMHQDENMENVAMLQDLFNFQIERCGLQEYNQFLAIATCKLHKHDEHEPTRKQIESMNEKAKEFLKQEVNYLCKKLLPLQIKVKLASSSHGSNKKLDHMAQEIVDLRWKKKNCASLSLIITNPTYTQNSAT